MPPKQVPCDQCRQRRVRCDGLLPCAQCQRTRLPCRREYVRKRRGPKYGNGRIIAALKADQIRPCQNYTPNREEDHVFPSIEVNPRLMKLCVSIYIDRLYSIMPVVRVCELAQWFKRPLAPNEHSMLLALCTVVITFMCGRSHSIVEGMEWRLVAQSLVEKSLAVRCTYNFIEDNTVASLLCSFFLAVSHFELGNSRQSWFYLREAITFAQGLRLDTDSSYIGMDHTDALYRWRLYNILFVTERSLAIARYRPVLLSHALPFPPEALNGECPKVDMGFRQLVQVYSHIDVRFIDFWSKQETISCMLLWESLDLDLTPNCLFMFDNQKADVVVTQHWLKLTFWKAALRQGLITSQAAFRSRTFVYPEDLAFSLLELLSSLPSEAVEVHGLGIFEKVYDVANILADLTDFSAKLTGWTEAMTQNLDRLAALQRYLSITPNSSARYSSCLGLRVATLYHCYSSVFDMANASGSFGHEDEIVDDEHDEGINMYS